MSAPASVKLQNPYVPIAYNLSIKVDLSTWSYEAEEAVHLERCPAYPDGDTIQLHAAPTMEVTSIKGATLVRRDATAHTLVLRLDAETISASDPTLHFHFKHVVNRELRGFYQVRFQHGGKEHRMASTHFEPVSARLFFICHDEPAQRADFTLSVALPKSEEHYTVLSNGPLVSKEVKGESVVHTFQMVPKCPSYLTACVVGELEHISTTVNNIPISVYTTLGKVDRAQFALDSVEFALKFFENFFQCKYPLPKLDLVAVPDFPIGGMENWGCITCVESVLIDQKKSSVDAKRSGSMLICHEVSHNWFGNLVAINWWEGLWLKEGFASWCGDYSTAMREPKWHALEVAALSVGNALNDDMYEHSHPVEVPILDPADITQIFDSISYNKGMGLVFMLQAFLGDKWGPAVAHYINKYQYKDTKTVQLWEALEESSQLPITEALTSFTTQMGYPMLHVSRKDEGHITVSQEPCRFVTAAQKCQQTWCVPYVVEGLDDAAGRVTPMLRGHTGVAVALPAEVAKSDFVNANPRRTGFYRCHYDYPIFEAWIANYTKLSPADRRALFSDTAAAIRMGYDDIRRLARIAEVVQAHETDIYVLREFISTLQVFLRAFDDVALRKTLRKEILAFLVPVAESLIAVKPENDTEELRRNFYLDAAVSALLGNWTAEEAAAHPLIQWALQQATSFLGGGEFSAATLNCCLRAYLQLASAEELPGRNAQLYAKLLEVDGSDELCRALITAMASSPAPDFAIDIMKKCIENSGVRSQYGVQVFLGLQANTAFKGTEVWDAFRASFKGVDAQWGGGQFRIQAIVYFVGDTLAGDAAATEFETFFKTHPLPNARLAIGRAVEDLRLRAWMNNKWKSSLLHLMRRH
ncbi:putative aminopeptidase [Leptomonas pyrrhocoris]|uniref:Aminopeptidase n=1 Tax=Leptomonas pyrrhocoris TaxID=157538 RepID=A0A0M9G1U0_LEPPY|nr:putative aminopeptidase [Leptomonas pyrrhocoris]XP_015659065.1 putative aminopeptidase [Leptomonas pyrrhocoris]KPA80625.1 putative aminopeptidase [Leptomonas pyrrhocoris]KPA80626.1 putative aminopeptidase [Leptomonas pyrrhocoris]|eukprot:XP_015659064.1 putative aminopeptidase [Leptomonas pyrrhocoris]